MTTEKHFLRVKELEPGMHFARPSLLKPLPDVDSAVRRARDLALHSGRPVSIRIESAGGKIKLTVNADGTGGFTETPGAV